MIAFVRFKKILITIAFIAAVSSADDLSAQDISLYGNIGSYSEVYNANGIADRRPDATQRLYGNLGMNLYGLKFGINGMYSTEEDKLRADINQIALNLEYKWLRLSGGMIYPELSRNLFQVVRLTGASAEINPGIFYLSGFYGKTGFKINGDSTSGIAGIFNKEMFGARIGLGSRMGDRFILSAVYAEDDTNSIRTRYINKPEKNIAAGVDTRLGFMDDNLQFAAETNISYFERDITSPAITSNEDIVKTFSPSISTTLGYALVGSAMYRNSGNSGELIYKRINPGYKAPGTGAAQTDIEEITFKGKFKFNRSRFIISPTIRFSHNNLENARLTTTGRYYANLSGMFIQSRTFSLNWNGFYSLAETTPRYDSVVVYNKSFSVSGLSVTPILNYMIGSSRAVSSMSIAYQNFATEAGKNSGIQVKEISNYSMNLGLNQNIMFESNLNLSAYLGYSGAKEVSTISYNVNAGYPMLNNKIKLSGGSAGSFTESNGMNSSTIGLNGQVMYYPWKEHGFGLQTNILHFSGDLYSFTESQASFTYNYSF